MKRIYSDKLVNATSKLIIYALFIIFVYYLISNKYIKIFMLIITGLLFLELALRNLVKAHISKNTLTTPLDFFSSALHLNTFTIWEIISGRYGRHDYNLNMKIALTNIKNVTLETNPSINEDIKKRNYKNSLEYWNTKDSKKIIRIDLIKPINYQKVIFSKKNNQSVTYLDKIYLSVNKNEEFIKNLRKAQQKLQEKSNKA